MLRISSIKSLRAISRSDSFDVLATFKMTKTTKTEPVDPQAGKSESQRLAEFRKKLRETTPIDDLGDQPLTPPTVKEDPLPPWPDSKNPHTGEINGPRGPEPTRYGDWERKGRVSDF